jgi:serine/threonine protein kinase
LLGTGSAKNIIHIIDFGLAKPFRSAETYIHVPCCSGRPLMGTARFASINALSGVELSRRDDLESLAYMLIYFLHGLPWQEIKGDSKRKHAEVLQMKVSTSPLVLCDGLPAEFEAFLNYARTLEFSQKPDYQYLRDLMRGVSQWPQNTIFDTNVIGKLIAGDGSYVPDSSNADETDGPATVWRGR